MTIGIYCIKNTVNNKKYIGQSINIKKRIIKHISQFKNNRHENYYMQKAWNKYGESSFVFEILEECSIEDLNSREVYWIEKLETYNKNKKGYNLKPGGKLKFFFTEYQRKLYPKLSKRKSFSNITKERMSLYHKQLFINDPNRFNGQNNPFYGKSHSEESKKKISDSKKGKSGHKMSPETRKKLSDIRKLYWENCTRGGQ